MKIVFSSFLFLIGFIQLQGQDGPNFPQQENCDIPFTLVTTPSDCGDSNGSATFNLQAIVFPISGGITMNGVPNYGFYNSNVITFTGLVPGSYEFRFEDRFGCVINGKFVIEQSFKATAIQFSCSPDADVTFFLEGGNPPYTSNDPNVTQFNSEFFLIYDLSLIHI